MPHTSISDLLNFVQITPLLAASGQPEREDISLIQQSGYQVVIYLATSASSNYIPEEAQIVETLGMAYFHIPVEWESPQPDQFNQFVDLLNQYKDLKILIHCAFNYRASCFMFLYKTLFMGADPETAWWDMLEIWEPDPNWKQFICNCLALFQLPPFSFLDAV